MKKPNTVQQLRNALGMTREEFGKALGVTRQTVWNMERPQRGRRRVKGRVLPSRGGASADMALLIAKTFPNDLHRLGLTAEDLMRGRRAAA